MTIILDHIQRLNLYVLIGVQKGSVSEMRSWWKLQDLLQLTEKEQEQIDYALDTAPNGIEIPKWNKNKKLDPKEFELSSGQIIKIKKVLSGWPSFTAQDRPWLESVLEQIGFEEDDLKEE